MAPSVLKLVISVLLILSLVVRGIKTLASFENTTTDIRSSGFILSIIVIKACLVISKIVYPISTLLPSCSTKAGESIEPEISITATISTGGYELPPSIVLIVSLK